MTLTPGTRLGPYEVNAPLGAGGMGEVYRATDSHLKRSVAIKVLPASMAGDADRLARFQREAEVLAALNHPNIAAIYGLEKTPNLTALVMELVEGQDLSEMIGDSRHSAPAAVGPSESASRGKTSVLRAAETRWWELRIAPDGQQLALVDLDKGRRIFALDLTRDVLKQVTLEGASSPVWTPGSKRLAFASDVGTGVSNLWLTNADGSGTPTRLTTSPHDQQPYSWDPTGKFLAYTEVRQNTARDVMVLPVEGDTSRGWKAGTPIAFKATATNEREPAFSPDGHWIAYSSSESGNSEIYVSPFPGPGAVVPVSTGGGSNPHWSSTTRELLYWNGGRIMSTSYTAADTFVPGKPQLWAPQDAQVYPDFDLHPEGKRVAAGLLDPAANEAARFARDKIVFWSGFADYLRKSVVVKK